MFQFLVPYLASSSSLANALHSEALGEHTQIVLDSLADGANELGRPELRDLIVGLRSGGGPKNISVPKCIEDIVRSADSSLLGRIVANRLLQGAGVAIEDLEKLMSAKRGEKRGQMVSMLKEGERLEQRGNLTEAYRVYSRIISEDADTEHPDIHVVALLHMGTINLNDKNFMHAAYTLKRILTMNPNHLIARWHYVQALIGLGQTMAIINQIDLVLLKRESLEEIRRGIDKPVESLSPKNRKAMEKTEAIGKEAKNQLERILDEAKRTQQYPIALFALTVLLKHTQDKKDLLDLQKRLHQEVEQKGGQPKTPKEFTRRDLVELSKTLGHALRHAPWEYELELDAQGWSSLDSLLEALKFRPQWALIDRDVLERTIATVSQGRYELKGDLIRACYGHSEMVPRITREKTKPPEMLYHGTDELLLPYILQAGIQRGQRQFVHLSSTPEKALQVASRKGNKPVLLIIRADEMFKKGYSFYHGNEQVWLIDAVPTDFLDIDIGLN